MLTFNHLRRRVSISHNHASLVVHIARHNDRVLNIVALLAVTAGFGFVCYVSLSPFFRRPFTLDKLSFLPFLAFILLACLTGLRVAVWRVFGVEEVVVDRGMLYWTRTARVEAETFATRKGRHARGGSNTVARTQQSRGVHRSW